MHLKICMSFSMRQLHFKVLALSMNALAMGLYHSLVYIKMMPCHSAINKELSLHLQVSLGSRYEYEFVHNYRILKSTFERLNVVKVSYHQHTNPEACLAPNCMQYKRVKF